MNALDGALHLLAPAVAWVDSLPYPALLLQVWAGTLVLALALALLALALRRRARSTPADRWALARQLAARGATPLEIARATGLSQDAAALLLHAGDAAGGRRILPLPARISGLGRAFPLLALRRRSA